MMFCYICKQETKYDRWCEFLRWHLMKEHNIKITEKEYYITYINKEVQICLNENCDNFTNFISIKKGYSKFCSPICCSTSQHMKDVLSEKAKKRFNNEEEKQKILDKRKKTNLEKYGFEHALCSPLVKEKIKLNCQEKYGVDSLTQIPSVVEARNKALVMNKDIINKKRSDSWTEEKKINANIKRNKTNLEKYGVENIMHFDYVSERRKEKFLEKYGSVSPFGNREVIEKCKKTFLERYGQTHPPLGNIDYKKLHEKRIKTCQEKYGWVKKEDLSKRDLYYKEVQEETVKNIKKLFNNWDGKCFYSKQILITDKTKYNEPLYRTIDHKLSILYGFKNNIDPKIIGNIDNLCICSRAVNVSKNYKTHIEYEKLINETNN